MRVLLTGASGFVGRAIQERLLCGDGYQVRSIFRALPERVPENLDARLLGGIGPDTDWSESLHGVATVVHSAARVHVMDDQEADPLSAFRHVNTEGTVRLARQAVEAGVRRFVFISSIKVNGEFTRQGIPFTADDVAAPTDPYGVSKLEAEQALRALAEVSGMEVVIIRPTLVYGPGVKANFLSMLRWLDKGVPLPLASIDNRRSLVALDNLVDLILTCMEHPAAANQTFLVSDGEDLSTSGLLRRMGQALGRPARLLPMPTWALEAAATLLGKRSISMRLCASLQVDISKTRRILGWNPPVSVDEALVKVARYFKETEAK
ncbi:SDR family oxidoreductase [Metapseudomonas lalkuanensis]|uniref:UDP-glucose 4-epimerase family protein n=1 Tax=Metapseudomonas lalkuanensis TaxID=2604832 RepID=UPI001CF54564|nr:SDR family oxidoreductase [Pseudomonas lalkuanensis]UCP00023.1 SDR family oxidoreductase [Pseudomonas lalkuanensis]